MNFLITHQYASLSANEKYTISAYLKLLKTNINSILEYALIIKERNNLKRSIESLIERVTDRNKFLERVGLTEEVLRG